jgi:hypothetical protein
MADTSDAGIKISELNEAAEIADGSTTEIPAVVDQATHKITLTTIYSYIKNKLFSFLPKAEIDNDTDTFLSFAQDGVGHNIPFSAIKNKILSDFAEAEYSTTSFESASIPVLIDKLKEYVDNKVEKSSNEVRASIKDNWRNAYPVGSLFLTTSKTNPSTLLGFGTWTQITGRFIVGSGQCGGNGTAKWGTNNDSSVNFAAEERGGEAWHTLTVNEMPKHSHVFNYGSTVLSVDVANGEYNGGMAEGKAFSKRNMRSSGNVMLPVGGGARHNNIPPYFACQIWQRTN